MSITTVPAGLDSQRELIVETLSRYLAGRSDDRWFDWLYALFPLRSSADVVGDRQRRRRGDWSGCSLSAAVSFGQRGNPRLGARGFLFRSSISELRSGSSVAAGMLSGGGATRRCILL